MGWKTIWVSSNKVHTCFWVMIEIFAQLITATIYSHCSKTIWGCLTLLHWLQLLPWKSWWISLHLGSSWWHRDMAKLEPSRLASEGFHANGLVVPSLDWNFDGPTRTVESWCIQPNQDWSWRSHDECIKPNRAWAKPQNHNEPACSQLRLARSKSIQLSLTKKLGNVIWKYLETMWWTRVSQHAMDAGRKTEVGVLHLVQNCWRIAIIKSFEFPCQHFTMKFSQRWNLWGTANCFVTRKQTSKMGILILSVSDVRNLQCSRTSKPNC